MKRTLLLLVMLLPMYAFAQNAEDKQKTKFEEFTSKTGSMLKFIDYNLPEITTKWYSDKIECSIRILICEGEKSYFYRINSPSLGAIAMIEYSDLVEINKAIVKLMEQVDADCALNPDYLENKFITEDDMRIGYYVSKGEANWYLKLERYSNSTVYIKDISCVADGFKDAQAKIEKLQVANK